MNQVDLQKLAASIQTIADDGEDAILSIGKSAGEALEKINSIDIDELNAGIKTLSEVLEPLAKFFKAFQ